MGIRILPRSGGPLIASLLYASAQTPDDPGQIYGTVQQIIEFWSGLGRVKAEITPADVIAHGIWSTDKPGLREASLR
jgi:hypothetical protein